MPENITFRTQLIGSVTEFCQDSKLDFLNSAMNLVELVVMLAHYKEEGVSLYPSVYLTQAFTELMSMLPGGDVLKVGTSTPNADGIKTAVKKCAPLAKGGWLIYIQVIGDCLEYGVFRGSVNPISVLVDDVLLTKRENVFVVKALQVAVDCVEVRSNQGGRHYIFLNHRRDDSPPPLKYIGQLIKSINARVDPSVEEPLTIFLERLLIAALQESHGCIIAVSSKSVIPRFLKQDGVILEHPIDFALLVGELRNDPQKAGDLESKGHLLKGMLNSDGIILFDNRGRLLGYNFFVKVHNKKNIVGGARKRAFESLASLLGKGLSAVFIQSQDGWTDFKENST